MDQLISRYDQMDDESLHKIYSERETFTEEARAAMEHVIEKRGGLSLFLSSIEEKKNRIAELRVVKAESQVLLKIGHTHAYVRQELQKKNYAADIIEEAIAEVNAEIQEEQDDKKITSGTISGGILGGLTGGTISGLGMGLYMAGTEKIMVLFVIGVFLCCYGFVKLFTRKSSRNVAVWIITGLSVIYAFVLAFSVYEMWSDK